MNNPLCKKYTSDEVLLDENSNCSLCGSPVNNAGECQYKPDAEDSSAQ